MNLLNIIQYYYPGIGGGVRNLREVSKSLSQLGHNVSIFTTTSLDNNGFMGIRKGKRPKNLPSEFFDDQVRVVRINPIIIPYLQKYWGPIRLGPIILPQIYHKILKGPKKLQTKGRHNAQYMTVKGSKENPVMAIIDMKLHYVPERKK